MCFPDLTRTIRTAVMWFRLQNVPATFQHFMNHILQEEIVGRHALAYVDDVIVFMENLNMHRYWMDRVLKKFWDNRLCLRLSKCKFEKETVIYLGLKLLHNQLEHDPGKAIAIRSWPRPWNL